MTIQIDPEGSEIQLLLDFLGDLSGSSVLEVGSGDGRLTWRYAERAGRVVGIDPKPEAVALAIQNRPETLHQRVSFLSASLEDFAAEALPRGERFDRVLLSWSL